MRSFKSPNKSNNWLCPICKTNEDKEVVLIGKHGTQDDGIIQQEQYHLDCIDLLEVTMPDKRKMLIMEFRA